MNNDLFALDAKEILESCVAKHCQIVYDPVRMFMKRVLHRDCVKIVISYAQCDKKTFDLINSLVHHNTVDYTFSLKVLPFFQFLLEIEDLDAKNFLGYQSDEMYIGKRNRVDFDELQDALLSVTSVVLKLNRLFGIDIVEYCDENYEDNDENEFYVNFVPKLFYIETVNSDRRPLRYQLRLHKVELQRLRNQLLYQFTYDPIAIHKEKFVNFIFRHM